MTMLAVCAFMLSFDALCGLAADWAGYRGDLTGSPVRSDNEGGVTEHSWPEPYPSAQ
jgi:hypothetical protein